MKQFLQRILQEIMKKNNTWDIRRLIDKSVVPENQQTSVLYWRLSDLKDGSVIGAVVGRKLELCGIF